MDPNSDEPRLVAGDDQLIKQALVDAVTNGRADGPTSVAAQLAELNDALIAAFDKLNRCRTCP